MKKYALKIEYYYNDYPQYLYTANVEFDFTGNAIRFLNQRLKSKERYIYTAELVDTRTCEILLEIDRGSYSYTSQYLQEIAIDEITEIVDEDVSMVAWETKRW